MKADGINTIWEDGDQGTLDKIFAELVRRMFTYSPYAQPPHVIVGYRRVDMLWEVNVLGPPAKPGAFPVPPRQVVGGNPIRAFCLAYCQYWDIKEPSDLVQNLSEEIFGPEGPAVERWGLNKMGAGLGGRVSVLVELGIAPEPDVKPKRMCQTAEDHFFATTMGGNRCFICNRTSSEVYGF